MSELGRIPGEDEHPQVTYDRLLFTVLEVDERRIERVEIELLPEEETEEEDDEKPRKRDRE